MSRGFGNIQQKILILLLGGASLAVTRSPKGYFRVLKSVRRVLGEAQKQSLEYAIRSLYRSRLIAEKKNSDGTTTLVITAEGKKIALRFNIDTMSIKIPKQWDKKWRIVIFDIPEKLKKSREILRFQLKRLNFYELQKSVFVLPYSCKDEIEYIIEFYGIRRFVRFIVAESIDNELHLKKHFNLL